MGIQALRRDSSILSLGREVDDRRRIQVLRLLESLQPKTIRAIASLRREHVRQLGRGSPLPSLMAAKD
jgi:hypothetical protein